MEFAVIIIVVLWVLDRLNPKDAPPLQVGVTLPRQCETPAGHTFGEGTRQIIHHRVVMSIADEKDGELPEQCNQKTPRPSFGQICLPKILVRENHSVRLSDGTVNVDNAVEIIPQRQRGRLENLGAGVQHIL